MNTTYKDSYGVVWRKVNKYLVFNEKLGHGLWDNGRDLVRA